MTTIAHALSASIVAVVAAGVAPDETGLIVAALVAGAIADADHVAPVIRDRKHYRAHGFRGNLHAARSPLHEMFGLLLAGIVGAVLWPIDARLGIVVFVAYSVHLAQDFVMGRSLPFSPWDRTEVQMFAAGFWTKAAVDVLVILVSLVLWTRFLSAPL